MSKKNSMNLIAVVSVIAALTAGTILFGGFANSKPSCSDTPGSACQSKMAGCPMTAQTASCPKTMAAQADTAGCPKTPCTEGPKPCCAGTDAEGTCENPCTIPCPKPCCDEKGCCEEPCPNPCPKPCCDEGGCCVTAEKAECCPMTATDSVVQ